MKCHAPRSIPAATTRTRTCPSRGVGRSTSRNLSTSVPYRSWVRAFMLPPTSAGHPALPHGECNRLVSRLSQANVLYTGRTLSVEPTVANVGMTGLFACPREIYGRRHGAQRRALGLAVQDQGQRCGQLVPGRTERVAPPAA